MKCFLTTVLILLVSFNIHAQSLVEKGRSFMYEGVEYRGEEEIGLLFSTNSHANYWYTESKSSADIADNLGILSIAGLTSSYFILRNVKNTNRRGPTLEGNEVLGLAVILVSSIVGVKGMVKKSDSIDQRQKAIDVFNGKEISYYPLDQGYEIAIGSTSTGLGIVFAF